MGAKIGTIGVMQRESTMAEFQGVKTHMVRVGGGDVRLILLHGWGGSAQSFLEPGLAEALATGLNGSVVCIDIPGFGDSGMPPKTGWGTPEYAAWLHEIVAKNGWSGVPLFGHSNGGRIILRLVLNHGHAAPIVLCAASGVVWPPSARERIIGALKRPFGWGVKMLPPAGRRFIRAKILRSHDWANVAEPLRETLRTILSEPDIRPDLPNITNKALLIWGERDGVTPLRSGVAMQNGLPNAELVTMPDGRHGIHRTHTKAVTDAVLHFLTL